MKLVHWLLNAMLDWLMGPKNSRLLYDESDEWEQLSQAQLNPPKKTIVIEEKRDTTQDYVPSPLGGLTP